VVFTTLFWSLINKAPAASWITNGPLNIERQFHTATLLHDGTVLIVGGLGSNHFLSSAELYNPATGSCSNTASLHSSRQTHTATLLPNGRVLVAGGWSNSVLDSAELYDPVSGTWTNTGTLNVARERHTATLLLNGKVLTVGGQAATETFLATNSAELYDPVDGTWTITGSMSVERIWFTATLLSDGKVLVVGGADKQGLNTLSSAELYDPVSGTWTNTGSLNIARLSHTATLLPDGKVLVAGGIYFGVLTNAEIYDPVSGTWTLTNSMAHLRRGHSASLLPNGQVLVAGGWGDVGSGSSAELFDSTSGTWTSTASLFAAREGHTATVLANGRVLVTSGDASGSGTELYDSTVNPATGTWTNTGAMDMGRANQSATLLPDGTVLVAGGAGNSGAAVYEPVGGIWKTTNSMNEARALHTATLLASGKVLVAGGGVGSYAVLSSAELYEPATGDWFVSGSMTTGRKGHTATLLPNGKVLVTGGTDENDYLSSAELFDPSSETWKTAASMVTNRMAHTATMLANGKVLVTGGRYGSPTDFRTLASSELFDPSSGTWTATGSLLTPRNQHTATLLPNGKVLVAGGSHSASTSSNSSAGMRLSSAELYDPVTGLWSVTGSMSTYRDGHSATLLLNGKVLATSGDSYLQSSELYDPATGKWVLTAFKVAARNASTATLLPDGRVLVAGGFYPGGGFPYSSAELYDVGLGFSNSWRPQISSVTSPLSLGSSLVVAGSGFRGISGASGGNTQDSSTDYPLVQLRSMANEQTMFLLVTNWSTNSFASALVWNFPPDYALVTVFVNGIPSTSAVINVSVPVPTPPRLIDAKKDESGAFQFGFTNSVGALFGVWATTNLSLPSSNWAVMGGVTEVSLGQFQFVDSQATNGGQRFYQVRSP
jgi:N-acetylneuraminic acid mutarotase